LLDGYHLMQEKNDVQGDGVGHGCRTFELILQCPGVTMCDYVISIVSPH
jgi:hypothetical protein